ncbi:hypothetical protein BIU82_13860 [Arthrobacter sp. SW1]|nr:hypothetical protein BIU82_13860 [Arthrobacter sp. SW1]
MARKLGSRGSCILRVAAMNALGTNLELFEYAGADRRSWTATAGEAGTFFLLLRTPRPERIVSRLFTENAVVRPVEEPVFGYEIALPSGIQLAIQRSTSGDEDAGRLIGAVCLNRYDYQGAVSELQGTFGLHQAGEVTAFGASGVLLTGAHGAQLAVLHGHSPSPRPANSDVGGHHVAFHADDVDASIDALRLAGGYAARGDAETITEGPIAGDRWVYLDSPFGLQLELINMPDGMLPYEAEAETRRRPIAAGVLA